LKNKKSPCESILNNIKEYCRIYFKYTRVTQKRLRLGKSSINHNDIVYLTRQIKRLNKERIDLDIYFIRYLSFADSRIIVKLLLKLMPDHHYKVMKELLNYGKFSIFQYGFSIIFGKHLPFKNFKKQETLFLGKLLRSSMNSIIHQKNNNISIIIKRNYNLCKIFQNSFYRFINKIEYFDDMLIYIPGNPHWDLRRSFEFLINNKNSKYILDKLMKYPEIQRLAALQ